MERRWRKDGGYSVVEEKFGGNLWREIWRKEDRHIEIEMYICSFDMRLS